MVSYKRLYSCTVCICIALVFAATAILQSFMATVRDSIDELKLLRTRNFVKNYDVNTVLRHSKPAMKDYGQISKSSVEPGCASHSSANKYLIQPGKPTNLTDWTYTWKWECPHLEIPNGLENIKRVKYSLYCFNDTAKLVPSFTKSSRDIQIVALNNTCLASFIDNCCTVHDGVPNIVHYVWYFSNEMKFHMFFSILSVIRFIRPCLILFHGEFLPYGKYWDYIVNVYPYILHIKRPRPLTISGKQLQYHTHAGDFMRIEAVQSLGGIYLDADTIILRDLEPFRKYDMTVCAQENKYLHSAFLMGKKNATFLNLWMDGYKKDYRNESYTYNAMEYMYNKRLAENGTDIVHVENGTLCAPEELVEIGKAINPNITYNWSGLYAYHLWEQRLKVPSDWDVNWIRNFNTTLGSMVRHIVYGNKELCN